MPHRPERCSSSANTLPCDNHPPLDLHHHHSISSSSSSTSTTTTFSRILLLSRNRSADTLRTPPPYPLSPAGEDGLYHQQHIHCLSLEQRLPATRHQHATPHSTLQRLFSSLEHHLHTIATLPYLTHAPYDDDPNSSNSHPVCRSDCLPTAYTEPTASNLSSTACAPTNACACITTTTAQPARA